MYNFKWLTYAEIFNYILEISYLIYYVKYR